MEANGVTVVYQKKLAPYVQGKVLDYVNGFLKKGFQVYDEAGGPKSNSC